MSHRSTTIENLRPRLLAERRPALNARIAAGFYFASVLTAVLGEFILPRHLGILGVIVPVGCYFIVTALLYLILKPVSQSLSLLAALFQFVALLLEALEWQPAGLNVAMLFHGLFCLAVGYLMLGARFLPRLLGLSIGFAGFVWLLYLSPTLVHHLSPFNTGLGLLGEAIPMIWLLVMGVNQERWSGQAKLVP